jgi:hypothetical protein
VPTQGETTTRLPKEGKQRICALALARFFLSLLLTSLMLSLYWETMYLSIFLFLFLFFLILFLFLPCYATMLTFVFALTLSLSNGKCTMLRQTQNELLS